MYLNSLFTNGILIYTGILYQT